MHGARGEANNNDNNKTLIPPMRKSRPAERVQKSGRSEGGDAERAPSLPANRKWRRADASALRETLREKLNDCSATWMGHC